MLRITIELVPHGIESRARVIAVGKIANNATGTPRLGNYTFELSKCGQVKQCSRSGNVLGFPRERFNAWHLLRTVLNRAFHNSPTL